MQCASPFPFLSYTEKGERRLSSGTWAGVSDSPRKHTGPVPVHPWQRAWFMARDPGLCEETGLRRRPGLILTLAVPHTWAPPGPRQVFFLPFGSLTVGTPVSNLKLGRWELGPRLVGTQNSGLDK